MSRATDEERWTTWFAFPLVRECLRTSAVRETLNQAVDQGDSWVRERLVQR